MEVALRIDGRLVRVELEESDNGLVAHVADHTYQVAFGHGADPALIRVGSSEHAVLPLDDHTARIDGRRCAFEIVHLAGVAGLGAGAMAYGPLHPPMTGRIDAIMVTEGQTVDAGDVLFVLEAMKMRNEVKAAGPATIKAVHVEPGAAVEPSTVVLELAPIAE